MAPIAGESIVSRRDGPLSNSLSETETVMLDIERGKYFGLRDVGKVIWEMLERPISVDSLCRRLLEEFEVDGATCQRDVRAFLEQLHEHGLVRVHDVGSAT